jgi:hypothetical protein
MGTQSVKETEYLRPGNLQIRLKLMAGHPRTVEMC